MIKYFTKFLSYAVKFFRIHSLLSFYEIYGKPVAIEVVRSAVDVELDNFTKRRLIESGQLLLESFKSDEILSLFDLFSKMVDFDNSFAISDFLLKMLIVADDELSVKIISNLLENRAYYAVEDAVVIYISKSEPTCNSLHEVFISHINKSITNPTHEISNILSRVIDLLDESKIIFVSELLFELDCHQDVIHAIKDIENPNLLNEVIEFFFEILRGSESYYKRVKSAEIIIQSGVDISFDVISVLSEFNLIHKINGDAFFNIHNAEQFGDLLYIITKEVFTGVFFDSYILKSWGESILEIQSRFGNSYAFEVAQFLIVARDYEGVSSNLLSKIDNMHDMYLLIGSLRWDGYLRCYDLHIVCDQFSSDKMVEVVNLLGRIACVSSVHIGAVLQMLKSMHAYYKIYDIISCASYEDEFISIIDGLKLDAYSSKNATIGLILYASNICGSKCDIPALNAVVNEWDELFYNSEDAFLINDVKSFIDSILLGFYKEKLVAEIQRDIKGLGVVDYMKSLFKSICLGWSDSMEIDMIYKVFILRDQYFVAESIYRLSNLDEFFDFSNPYSGFYITCPEYGCDLQDRALYNVKDIAHSIQHESISIDHTCNECLDSYVSALFYMEVDFENDVDLMTYERVYACCSCYFEC